MPTAVPELIDIETLAQLLGDSVRHVRRLVAEHRVSPISKSATSSVSTPPRSSSGWTAPASPKRRNMAAAPEPLRLFGSGAAEGEPTARTGDTDLLRRVAEAGRLVGKAQARVR